MSYNTKRGTRASTLTDAQERLARAIERAGLTTISQARKAFERGETEKIEDWKRALNK